MIYGTRLGPIQLCLLAATWFTTTLLHSAVQIHPYPDGVEASKHYEITLEQGEQSYRPFVYESEAQIPKYNLSETTSYSIFSFTGEATIRIKKLEGVVQSCKVLPSSYGIEPTIDGDTVTIAMSEPKKVSVEFDGNIIDPLLIFADEPEKDVPDANDPDVIYFGPGLHDLEDPVIRPNSGQTVYLAGGAVVNAYVRGEDADNVVIRGKGILNGRPFGHTHGRHILFDGKSTNTTVQDITIVDSPGFYVTTRGDKTLVKNIKGLGWWFNTDGVATGPNGIVEDCFLKCNDDAVKLYHSGTEVYRTTIWQMENGAPFQISWNMNSDNSGFIVKDCDIIRCDHFWDNTNTAIFASIHGGGGHMSDYLFEDIRIENCDWRLFSIQIRPNQFARSDTLGKISNLHFKNITIDTPDNAPLKRINLFQGWDSESTVSDITIENLRINGKLIDSLDAERFELEPNSTSNIKVIATADAGESYARAQDLEGKDELSWTNPLWNTGLNSYGNKDFHIYFEDGTYYLTATEVPNNEWGKRGIILYASEDLVNWREEKYLINRRSLGEDVWYRDDFQGPKIYKIKNKYYMTFCARNNKNDPYGRLGLAIAVADDLKGPWTVMNEDELLAYGANASLFVDGSKVYAYWDLDGYFYMSEMNLKKGEFKAEPKMFLGPEELGEDYRFLDAPFVMKKDGQYLMISSSFYGGYVIRVRQLVADSPKGPWTLLKPPLMTWLEDEADMNILMPWPDDLPFAPPTQVIFHHQIFKGPGDQWMMAYHSSEKYSEPYLVLEPVEFDENDRILLPKNKETNITISLK